MANPNSQARELIEGNLALIVIDIQAGTFVHQDVRAIDHQSDYFVRVFEDCVAGSSENAHEYSLQAMDYLQTGARRSLDEVLTCMDAHHADKPAVAVS